MNYILFINVYAVLFVGFMCDTHMHIYIYIIIVYNFCIYTIITEIIKLGAVQCSGRGGLAAPGRNANVGLRRLPRGAFKDADATRKMKVN